MGTRASIAREVHRDLRDDAARNARRASNRARRNRRECGRNSTAYFVTFDSVDRKEQNIGARQQARRRGLSHLCWTVSPGVIPAQGTQGKQL
jgi:hypothetical protein